MIKLNKHRCWLIILILAFFGCNKTNIAQSISFKYLIQQRGVGDIKVGEILPGHDYIDGEVKFITYNDTLHYVEIYSQEFRTAKGFGIGSTFKEIEKELGEPDERKIALNQGGTQIGSFGSLLAYGQVVFLDVNDDNIVSNIFIWRKNR